METDEAFRQFRDGQTRFHERFEEIEAEINSILDGLEHQMPSEATASRLGALRREADGLFREDIENAAVFIRHLQELEESRRRTEMAEKRSEPRASQAQIQELSAELNTNLRLERVDNAIKELLGFLADAEFFAANASTGRRRRLRALQNAIEKALQK